MSLICFPIQARTLAELKKKIQQLEKKADIIEIWIDQLRENLITSQIKKLVSSCSKPLLIVNKPKEEQGNWHGSESDRIKKIIPWIHEKSAYVDVNYRVKSTDLKKLRSACSPKSSIQIILSYHNFESTPSLLTLQKIYNEAAKKEPDLIKIVTFAQTPEDNKTIYELLLKNNHPQKIKLIAHTMGTLGKISRIIAPLLGSQIVYLSSSNKAQTAPGQLTYQEYQACKKSLTFTP